MPTVKSPTDDDWFPGDQPPPTPEDYYDAAVQAASSGSPSNGGGAWQAPAGVPQDWAEDFIRRNPGDYSRVLSAYAPTSHREYNSNGPAYNQTTNQLNPGYGPKAQPAQPPGPSAFGMGSPQNFNTFNDPLTQQYEKLLQTQLAMYQQQQASMQAAATAAEQRRAATGPAADRLTNYVNERVGKLQGPAYTGTEGEVLRSQFLDPLERDRTAARQRALEQIGSRGFDPSSGIAQKLLQDVDRAFDEQRTRGQGAIATRQIDEQRSRDQEAQQLLQYLTMLPDAVARGDLDFVSYVQNLIAQPGQAGVATGGTLADIPTQRLNDALATLGIAPNIGSASNSSMQLLQMLQQQRYIQQQQQAQYFGNIGQSFGL